MNLDRRLPVVLVPGSITPAELSYRNLLQELGDEVHVVPKELEVYASDAPPPGYGLDAEAKGIRRAADDADFDTFHLVGYSGGGASSLAFTAKHPEMVRSLALVEPAWIGNEGWTPDERAYWDEIYRINTLPPDKQMEGFMRLNAGRGKVSPPSGPQPDWMAKRPAGVRAITRAFEEYDLDVESLRRFNRPVYIAVGGLSHPSEMRKAERLSTIFPEASVEVYEERHHMDPPHRGEAARFAKALRDLWDNAERRRARAA